MKLRLAVLSACLAAVVAVFVLSPGRPPADGHTVESSLGAAASAEPVRGPVPVAAHLETIGSSAQGLPTEQAVISPDGQALVITGPRADDDRSVVTLFLVVDGEPPRDLLPGSQAVHGVSTAKFLTGWIDAHTFAYEEHVGTGARQLFLLDTRTWKPIATERLAATYFRWSPDRRFVAGQWEGGPPLFWVWNRDLDQMVVLPEFPGDYHYIEDWSLDGRHLLFSAWSGAWPADETTTNEYYVLDIVSGEMRSVGAVADTAE